MIKSGEFDRITTPLYSYVQSQTGSEIYLIGTVHSAQPKYYADIGRIIAGHQAAGATIYYEGLRDTKSVRSDNSLHLQKRYCLQKILDASDEMYAGMGLVRQADALPVQPSWQRADATVDELIDQLKTSSLIIESTQISTMVSDFKKLPKPARKRKAYMDLLYDVNREPVERVGELNHDGIHIYRNSIVIDALTDQIHKNPASNAAVVWGCGHINAIRNSVEGLGYSQNGESSVTAIDLYSFLT